MHYTLHRRQVLSRALLLSTLVALPRPAFTAPAHDDLPGFIRGREEWGAAPAGDGLHAHTPERITVHHTGPPAYRGTPAPAAYLRAIQAFHTGPRRRWPDIAYHLLIDRDGDVWQGRDLAFAGDSATAYDPAGHLLVALLGDFDQQEPAVAQVDALRITVRWLLERFGLETGTLGGHRDYAATACPGAHLYALLPGLLTPTGET